MNDTMLLWYAVTGFFALMVYVGWRSRAASSIQYLTGKGDESTFTWGLSIAATWIWAPALFISAQKAYQYGWIGLFWFLVPNVLCLLVFGWYANRAKQRYPLALTLPQLLTWTYDSKRINSLYVCTMGGLAILSYAVQLLAGGAALHLLLGIPREVTIVALSVLVAIYSGWGGLRASIASDKWQMLLMVLLTAVTLLAVLNSAGGTQTLIDGMRGVTGEYGSLFDDKGIELFWAFGAVVTISLMAGPFGDHSFWQRAFAMDGNPLPKFALGAVIFAVVPLMFGLLGLIAAGTGLDTNSPQTINLQVVREYAPLLVVPIMIVLLAGLTSTMDSALAAMMSLWAVDVDSKGLWRQPDKGPFLAKVKKVIAIPAIVGVLIALIPEITILHLFLFYGTLRAATFGPTLITLQSWENSSVCNQLVEPAMFWGIIGSLVLGLPVSAYGLLNSHPDYVLIGILLTFGVSTSFMYWVRSSNAYKVLESVR